MMKYPPINAFCLFSKQTIQIYRIQFMESQMDLALNLLKNKEYSSQDLTQAIQTLQAYVQSRLWLHDFEADEQHLLPPNLKRGVLSEDGLDSLFDQVHPFIQ